MSSNDIDVGISLEDAYSEPKVRKPKFFENLDFDDLAHNECDTFESDTNIVIDWDGNIEIPKERRPDTLCDAANDNLKFLEQPFSELSKKMVNIHPDNLVKKLVLTKGHGKDLEVTANSAVVIDLAMYCEGRKEPIGFRKSLKKIELNKLLPGIQYAISSMRTGERAQFLINHKLGYNKIGFLDYIPKESDLFAEIELHNVFQSLNDSDNSISAAKILKEEGNAEWKKQKFEQCLEKYNEALEAIEDKIACDEETEQLITTLHVNIAIVCNRMNRFAEAMHHAELALKLDATNKKALFNLSKAYMNLGKYREARDKLDTGRALYPKCKDFDEAFKQLEKKQNKDVNSESEVLKKLGETAFFQK